MFRVSGVVEVFRYFYGSYRFHRRRCGSVRKTCNLNVVGMGWVLVNVHFLFRDQYTGLQAILSNIPHISWIWVILGVRRNTALTVMVLQFLSKGRPDLHREQLRTMMFGAFQFNLESESWASHVGKFIAELGLSRSQSAPNMVMTAPTGCVAKLTLLTHVFANRADGTCAVADSAGTGTPTVLRLSWHVYYTAPQTMHQNHFPMVHALRL